MTLARTPAALVYVPTLDMTTLATVEGVPQPGTAPPLFVEALRGQPLTAYPVAKLLREGHAAVLHRDDDLDLIPAQQQVLEMLGVETMGFVASQPVEGWLLVASFGDPRRREFGYRLLAGVQSILDRRAAELHELQALCEKEGGSATS